MMTPYQLVRRYFGKYQYNPLERKTKYRLVKKKMGKQLLPIYTI